MADKSKCKTQVEVDYINAAVVMQQNYDNLRKQNEAMTKQALQMARLLKLVANDNKNEYSAEANRLLLEFESVVPF